MTAKTPVPAVRQVDSMDYSQILEQLNNASLFELYRLEQAIRHSLEDPARIATIKSSLKSGQVIEYFDAEENRLIEASIVKLNRTRLLVKNRHDGKLWNIPYYHINLDHVDIAIVDSSGKLSRNSLKVGAQVAFKDKKGNELFGEVVKLNQKTAGVLVGAVRWRVGYGLMSLVIDGEMGSQRNLIGGQLIGRA
jgi:hypothetical protein